MFAMIIFYRSCSLPPDESRRWSGFTILKRLELRMKRSPGSFKMWLIAANIVFSLIISLSCCGPSDSDSSPQTPGESSEKGSSATGEGDSQGERVGTASGRPPSMIEKIAQGKKEKKVVMVELYDKECEYCLKMDRVLKKKSVKGALKDIIHTRVIPTDEGVIEEFGLTQSPSYMFFDLNGEYMPDYLDGYRSSGRFVAEIENFKLRAQGAAEKPVADCNHPDFQKG